LPPCPSFATLPACHIESWNVDQLRACVLRLAAPVIEDPFWAAVLIDCKLIAPQPFDGGDGSYWTFDMSTNTITFAGPICDDYIIKTGAQRVDVVAICSNSP
jgi:hypothetical protein